MVTMLKKTKQKTGCAAVIMENVNIYFERCPRKSDTSIFQIDVGLLFIVLIHILCKPVYQTACKRYYLLLQTFFLLKNLLKNGKRSCF